MFWRSHVLKWNFPVYILLLDDVEGEDTRVLELIWIKGYHFISILYHMIVSPLPMYVLKGGGQYISSYLESRAILQTIVMNCMKLEP